jgi:hypothetical protein
MVDGAAAKATGESVPKEISSKAKSLPNKTVLRLIIERFAVVVKPEFQLPKKRTQLNGPAVLEYPLGRKAVVPT